MISSQHLIELYKLQPHPEGGHYLRTYCSTEQISAVSLPERFKANRFISTAIYFLLEGKQFSAFHRIKSDELWHFYAGCGLSIYVIHPNGEGEILKLGNDIENGYSFQQVVKAGCWFASKPADENGFAFVGCTVAPGFDFEDFEMGEKEELMKAFPKHRTWFEELCR
jgi:predicted cupin superfamily sugar epimerase